MTTSPLEYSSSPQVELRHGLAVLPAAVTAANSSADPAESIREGILAYRLFAMQYMGDELLNATIVNDTVIRKTLDLAWQAFFPHFRQITGPMLAEAYIRAFRDVRDDRVPITLIYDLADNHAERIGKYFNDTSADAMVQGFNTYVNRQVPKRAVLERIIDAFGLTPRQMSGYTSAAQLNPTKVDSAVPMNTKAKIKQYIGKSISDRLDVFQRQEAHNLDQQAQQVAWMWMTEQGKLPAHTKKMWITAKDEKVCKVCGPMNRKKVKVGEQFTLPDKTKVYVPGAHVNCRCYVRLQMNPFELVEDEPVAKAFDESEHRRARDGRFTHKPKLATKDPRAIDADTQRLIREVQMRDAIAAAKLQELREARLEQKKKLEPQALKPKGKLKSDAAPLKSSSLTTEPKLGAKPLTSDAKLQSNSKVESKLKLEPKQREALMVAAVEEMLALEAATQAAPRQKFKHDVKLDKPVYRIGDETHMEHPHADNRRAWFDEDDNQAWYTDKEMVIGDALDAVDAAVDSEIWRVMNENTEAGFEDLPDQDHIVLRDGQDELYIPREYVERAVHSVAWGEYSGESDPHEPIPLTWYNRRSYQPSTRPPLRFQELVERLGIDPEFFVQTVFITEAGNSDQTEQLDAGSRHGYETWKLWGGLRIISESGPREESTNFPIRFVHLDSDADEELG